MQEKPGSKGSNAFFWVRISIPIAMSASPSLATEYPSLVSSDSSLTQEEASEQPTLDNEPQDGAFLHTMPSSSSADRAPARARADRAPARARARARSHAKAQIASPIPAMASSVSSSSPTKDYSHDQQCPTHHTISVLGRRREMEDAVAVVPALASLPCYAVGACTDGCTHSPGDKYSLHFFGVYDGHGGSEAALFCKERLHVALLEELRILRFFDTASPESVDDWEAEWQKVMLSCFNKVDLEVSGHAKCDGGDGVCGRCSGRSTCGDPIAPETVGSTAIVAVISSSQLIVANCGDSRAILSRGGKVIALSSDHKPDRKDEMARVEAAGGRVIYWDGYRVLGILAMSRAIGDRYLKPYVIADPEVKCFQRAEEDEFLIMATDGLWDVVSNEVACNVVRKYVASRRNLDASSPLMGEPSQGSSGSLALCSATLLTKLALARGSTDNISVVVIDLRRKRP